MACLAPVQRLILGCLGIAITLMYAEPTIAQQKCSTTLDCAQAAVEAAARAEAAAKAVDDRMTALREQVEKLKGVRIECTSISATGQSARCPATHTVTGCTAGKNYASTDLGVNRGENGCFTHVSDADWTVARCSRLTY